MTALAFLAQLDALAVVVTPTPVGTLRYKAPAGVMTPVLLDGLRQYKAALLALLAPPARGHVTRCLRIGPHNPVKQFHPVTRALEWRCSLCNALDARDPL